MTEKDWFGIGAYTRYGMVSGFQPGTAAATNNLYAKMNGLSITPVYAHKFDNKWSAAVGAEINYVGLEMNKDLAKMNEINPNVAYGMQAAGLIDAATAGVIHDKLQEAKDKSQLQQMQLKGESFALGWNAAVNYTFDKKNDMGIVYRSKIKHSLEADLKFFGYPYKGDAYGVVTLPDQWTIGYNHKFDDKNRVELNATRTNWHTYDALNMNFSGFPGGERNPLNAYHPGPKNWKDTWRYAIGYEHKFSDKYTGLIGFSFDDHAIPYDGGDFIVPTGVRRTYSIGLQYNDKKQTFAVAYAHEQIGDLSFKFDDKGSSAHTHNNYAKIISVGYSYKF